MLKLRTYFLIFCGVGLLMGCKKDEEEEKLDFQPCDCGNATLETVMDQVGEVSFNTELQKYAINWAIPNTIDSKKVYFLCVVPKAFEQEGVRVRFSGEAKEPCTMPTDLTGGQQFYDIRLTKLEKAN